MSLKVVVPAGPYLALRASSILKQVKEGKDFGDQPVCSHRKSLLS